MAKSKLGVVENGAEQTVVEPKAGIGCQSAPFDIPAPSDVVVSFEKIKELLTESKAAEQIAAQNTLRDTPAPEEPPEKKTARQEQPPKPRRPKRRRLPRRIWLPHRKEPKGRKRNWSLLPLKRPDKHGRPETRR
ncbi:MAG: hypothetical protein ACOYJC_11505 [Christensenellales bacterium]